MAKDKTVSTKDPFIDKLQSTLLSQSSMVSSSNSGIDEKINKAISSTQESAVSSAAAITSSANRQIGDVQTAGQTKVNTAFESQRGFATNNALIQQINDQTNKDVKDLDMRKQELIMQGNATAASKVSDLQIASLQFKQQSQQQAFTNLLALGNFGLQAKESKLKERAQKTQEGQFMAQIGLQYGVQVNDGDTIETITARAAPFASTKQKLELDKMRADIANSNAQRAKAFSDIAENRTLDSGSIDAIANAYLTKGDAVLGTIKNSSTLSQVINRAAIIQQANYKSSAAQDKDAGVSKNDSISGIQNNQAMTAVEKAQALKAVEDVYGKTQERPTNKFTLPNIAQESARGTLNLSASVLEFLTGTGPGQARF